MNRETVYIRPVESSEKIPFKLLQLADPSLDQINTYLTSGSCFLAVTANRVVGVMVLDQIDSSTTEIKNIAVDPSFQGQGIGKRLLDYAAETSLKANCKNLVIATGNSSTDQMRLYQKAGFEMNRLERNFFVDHYDEPIFENGIQCKHKVVFQKTLG